MSRDNWFAIRRIEVERLFGRYSYCIWDPVDSNTSLAPDRLILLYGDNGSGKTTILNLVYHLLSPYGKKGHRTYLGRTPFQRFSVSLGNMVDIAAVRTSDALTGDYTLRVSRDVDSIMDIQVTFDESGKISTDESELTTLYGFLNELRIFPFYLSENRSFAGDTLQDAQDDNRRRRLRNRIVHSDISGEIQRDLIYAYGLAETSALFEKGQEVQSAIDRVETWLRQQAYTGTNTGLANANAVYFEVLQHLATAVNPEDAGVDSNLSEVGQRLESLAQRADKFAQFDLGTPFPASRFHQLLTQAPPDRRWQLGSALIPHLDSSEAQLDALQDLYNLLDTFTSSVNSFLVDKVLRCLARRGDISIYDQEGVRLDPSALSSGERQLLLLLCNTLVARDSSRLFIIDEPEISLNVKWQRQLLEVLLELTAGTNLQFLVATHSIEMVATHKESVHRLAATNAD